MRLSSLAIASLLAAGTTTLFADSFTPYSNVNHPITTSSPVTYSGANGLAGGITAYFYSVSAGDTDTISVYDASQGTFLSPTNAFNNQASGTIGSSVVFDSASLHNGDTLYFVLSNQQIPGIFSSDAHSADAEGSTDGYDHAYITPFSGTIGSYGTIVGTYVGMEDLPSGSSDWDYNDDTFVFTNTTSPKGDPSPTPEPSTFALLGTGLLGAAGALRRKFAN